MPKKPIFTVARARELERTRPVMTRDEFRRGLRLALEATERLNAHIETRVGPLIPEPDASSGKP